MITFVLSSHLHSWHTPIWNVCATLLKWGTVNSLPSQTDLHNQPLICIVPSSPWDIMICTQRKMTIVSIAHTVYTLCFERACMLVKVGKCRTGQGFCCACIPSYKKKLCIYYSAITAEENKTSYNVILDEYLFRARFISFLYNILHNLWSTFGYIQLFFHWTVIFICPYSVWVV